MGLIETAKKMDLFQYRKYAAWISIAAFVITLVSLATQGMNWGLDFTGGILVTINIENSILDADAVREAVNSISGVSASVQSSSVLGEFLIRLPSTLGDQAVADLLPKLEQALSSKITLISSDFIGAQVGSELRDMGGIGFVASLIAIALYLAVRFQYKFAIGAVIATLHDVIFVVGSLSVFQVEFDLTALAALLAITGYSVNDTIVIYDYIRERFKLSNPKTADSSKIISEAVSHTLDRTLITSLLTLFVALALLIFGGDSLFAFSLVLLIGIIVGTFSSIFIASFLVLLLKVRRDDLVVSEEAKRALDAAP